MKPDPDADEARLRAQARVAIRRWKLPTRAPDRTSGGHGVGAPYSVRDLPITKDELEIEIDFAHEGSAAGVEQHHFHPRCFATWE